MEEAEKHCFKTLAMANARQNQPKNNKMPMSSSQPPSHNAGPSPKRIINKIPLDFNKLKQVGLHVKLAEALSKQNMNAAKNIASATTASATTSATSAAAAQPNATTPAMHTQKQQQREHQTASKSVGNNSPATATEPSSHIKALIKNKIMNKSAQSQVHRQPTDTTTTAPSTEISGLRSGAASGGFTMPIAKADLTLRAKPALLLNLVNQLPKQRATCGSIKPPQQQKRQQESTPPRSTPSPPRAGSSPVRAQAKAPPPAAASAPLAKSPPPLIVLENKVLAPNEKIDLRALRLPNGQSAAVPPSALTIVPTTPNETRNADNLKEPMEKAKDILGKLQGSSAPVKKMILNVNKLKVPREELAQLAKEVRKQAMQHVQQQKQPSMDIPAIIPVPSMGIGPAPSLITTLSPTTRTKICSSMINPVTSTSTCSATPKTTIPSSSLITPIVKTCPNPMVASADEASNNQVSFTATTSRGKPTSSSSSPVAVKAEPESDELSAVDFIEQLTAKKDADPNNYLELSAEELSMNAKFGSTHSSKPAPVTVRPEDDLPIGKILQMQDMDILHATLNVNGNKPNVLCISPNAIKLQSSASPEETESPLVDDKDGDSTSISKFQPLKVTAPKHVYTNTKRKTPLSTVTSLVETSAPTQDETKDKAPVRTVEAECAKEKPQPVKQVPYKPKRGKVNLVQRNKKASAPKPNETNIATKVAEEPFQVSDTEISSDIAEVTRETPADEEIAPKAAGNKEQSQKEVAEKLIEINPAREDLDTTKRIEKKVEDVESTKADKIVISNKTESVITEEAAKAVMNPAQMNLSKERDLTQLYHPPKLPKHKQNPSKPKDNQNEEHTPAIVLPFDAAKREPAPPQGKPQLPFRSSEQNDERLEPMNRTFADALGIQNLVSQLAAEKVVPPSKGKEVKSEETAKLPRKKLVKTRPVLSTKRSAKAAQSQATAAESKKTEPLVPRKRPLTPESQHRAKTSSTSDDDGDMFHGFDNGASSCKRFKHSEEKETDISDDASPDYDDMEEEPQPDMEMSAKKTKTESVVNNTQTASMHTDAAAVNLEDAEPMEPLKEDTLKKTASRRKTAMQEAESEQTAKRPRTASAKVKDAKKKSESKWKVKVKGSAPANGDPSAECAKEENVSNEATPEETGIKEPIIVKKKRGRPRKSAVIADTTNASLSESANPLDSSADSSMPPVAASTPDAKRRGRKTKDIPTADNENITESCRQTNDFYHRLLLTRSRQQLVSGEELREDNAGEGDLQCGLCLVRCEKADWRSHLGEHYGVGWLIEEPAPLLTRSSVLKMMKTYLDAGSKRLNCRLCCRSLTSALGMMLHLEGCGIKERMVCESCKGSYTKLSYPSHVRTCPKRRRTLTEEDQAAQAAAEAEMENSAPVYSNAGRTKRKSTLKAETKLEKIAAQTKELGVDETENSKGFDGDAFDYDLGPQKDSSDEVESDGADSSQTDGGPARSSTKKEHKPAQKTLYGRINVKKVMKDRWNHFTETNYAKGILYPHLVPRFEKLSAADARQLLPSKDSTSMRYAYDKVEDNNWMQLKPMESVSKEYEHILYLGNAVKELAWVPLPSTVETQYLLCSQRNKILGYSRQFKDKPENALLLLIECKTPPAGDDSAWTLQTRLHYGICVPDGPVHSLAFMASGGYDESINRLGLLAVGGLTGAVIYALPLHLNNDTEQAASKEMDDVIVLQPMLKLILDIDNPLQDACTKICWSESSGHNLLVSGYASGNVAFYDISDEQGLNCVERNNQRHFLPAHFFYFGERNIYNLELHYDTNGARWLAIGTNMRKLWVYDIANWSQPLPISGDTVCNMFMGGLNWSPLWEALAVGCTEVYKSQFPRLLALNPSGISFSHSTLDVVLSSPRGMHFNWEQLTLVAVTDNGDVAFLQCNQFNLEMMLQKRTTNCRTVCSTEPCLLSGAPESNTISPEQFKRDYGLILKPLKNVANDKKSTYINLKRRPSFDLLNLMRLNSVRWNWNEPARNWVVVGAEHGLLRIIQFEEGKHFRFF